MSTSLNEGAVAAPPRDQRRRRRPAPLPVEVVSVSVLTPRLISVHLGGRGLEAFEGTAPTSHIKVLLPSQGQTKPVLPEVRPDGAIWPADDIAPVVRTYTPRRYDLATGTLEVQFVLHGEGPASDWASKARPGDHLAVAGPGGRFTFDPNTTQWWIGGDESAIPAIGTLLDALSTTAHAEVHLEVEGADNEITFESTADIEVFWHHRRSGKVPGTELYDVVGATDIEAGARVWVACEATAVRRIRRQLIENQGMAPDSIVTRGYWRLDSVNHPDHDYGDDN